MAFDLATAKPVGGFDLATAKPVEAPKQEDNFAQALGRQVLNAGAGALRGAGSIGATLLAPIDYATDYIKGDRGKNLSSLVTGKELPSRNAERRQAMTDALQTMGADVDSLAFGAGKLGGEIAGTAGMGGAVANALGRVPGVAAAAPNVLQAIRTAGMSAGNATGKTALALRTVGGGVTGAASAGLVNPEDAATGAMIGGALPAATKLAGAAGRVVGAGARAAGRAIVGDVAPDVVALAERAKALGINIPADRLVDSKPLNAVAASLNYMPMSGRAGTEDAMLKSMDRALSRTFGQDSDNVTAALRKAQDALGAKFDAVLQGNTVQMTPAFKTALAEAETQANSELGPEAAAIIRNQIAQIQTKGAAGAIEGQAAYNIKKALDRIGRGSSDAAFYARDLKQKLMTALNESLGPQEAAAFSKVRQQYGNMMALEKMAQNGAEGGISVGRLANMKNINNPDLQELADIAAQFLRTRESPHGALQRLVIGGTAATTAGGLGMLPVLPAAVGAGRGVNAILNSEAARNAVLGLPGKPNALQALLANSDLAQLGYRTAPVLAGGR
jgi:hypothetical protein